MADAVEIVSLAWTRGIRPEALLSPTEWADKHRILTQKTSAEPGPYDSSRTPYMREIMDSLGTDCPAETVVFQKAAQIGASEAGNNWIGWIIDHSPGPTMCIQPTVDLAKRYSKDRISTLLRDTPRLRNKVRDHRSRDSGNTILQKDFEGGTLIVAGANSAAGLRSTPARRVMVDEIDAYPLDVEGEGDPFELVKKRTNTYRKNRKLFVPSTPTVRGISRVEKLYNTSDKRKYFVPCPLCGGMQTLEKNQLLWDKDGDGNHVFDNVRYVCIHCKGEFHEYHKDQMLPAGEWRATELNPKDHRCRGYHMNALYAPLGWYSWEEAAIEWVKANKEGPEALKTYVNTVLAETWEEAGDRLEHTILFKRRERYGATVPAAALVLIGSVDVQKDRIEAEVTGFGASEEAWHITRRVIDGDPTQPEVWRELDRFLLDSTFKRADGAMMKIHATGVDSGAFTKHVYTYCRPRAGLKIWPLKGFAGEGRPIIGGSSRVRIGDGSATIRIYPVGVDSAKTILYSRLAAVEPGPGYHHFPISYDYDEDYFSQLAAEQRVTRYRKSRIPYHEWVRVRPRNEALDLAVYALATLYISGLREVLAQPKERRAEYRPTGRQRESYATSWRRGYRRKL